MGGINFSIGSASVEWYEQGETKGKDIDLAVIESLNPDIKIVRPNDLNESSSLPRVVPPISQKVSRAHVHMCLIITQSHPCSRIPTLLHCCLVPGTNSYQRKKAFVANMFY